MRLSSSNPRREEGTGDVYAYVDMYVELLYPVKFETQPVTDTTHKRAIDKIPHCAYRARTLTGEPQLVVLGPGI